MVTPLLWNSLDEAAEWLSDKTGIKWNPKTIIDFSIQQYRDKNKEKVDNYFYSFKDGKRIRKAGAIYFTKESLAITLLPPSPTYLSVKFPKPVPVGLYRYQADIKKPMPASYEPIAGGLARVFNYDIRFAPLYPKHLGDIYLYGESVINQPSIEFIHELGWEYALFDPIKSLTSEENENIEKYSRACRGYLPHDAIAELGGSYRITAEMVGIHKENLIKMLQEVHEMNTVENLIRRESQIHKEEFKVIARSLWKDNPNLNQAEIIDSDKMEFYRMNYKGKNTLRDWIREADPRPKESRRGRPPKKYPSA